MAVHTQLLPRSAGNPHPLGRHVEHDDLSRAFAYKAAPVQLRPVLWSHHGPILDQGQIGSCTGNALVQCLATGPLYRPGFVPTEKEALKVYSLATGLDSVPGAYPPDDTGSSGLAVAKAAVKLGLIRSYRHVFGIDHAKATILDTPFMVGTEWLNGMFTPDQDGFLHLTGQVDGGHEYVVLGYDPTPDVWTCLQSWGKWGDSIKGVATTGIFRIHGKDFATLLANQGDITVPVR